MGSAFFGQEFLSSPLPTEPRHATETPLGYVVTSPSNTWHYLVRTLFGLDPALREGILLEPFFLLGYYFGMSWSDYKTFPLTYRKWLVHRIDKEIGKAAKAGNDIAHKAPHGNPPDLRELTGKVKTFGSQNARMQRFT